MRHDRSEKLIICCAHMSTEIDISANCLRKCSGDVVQSLTRRSWLLITWIIWLVIRDCRRKIKPVKLLDLLDNVGLLVVCCSCVTWGTLGLEVLIYFLELDKVLSFTFLFAVYLHDLSNHVIQILVRILCFVLTSWTPLRWRGWENCVNFMRLFNSVTN